MKKNIFIILIFCFYILVVNAQEQATISEFLEIVKTSEILRNELLQNLPQLLPWESEKEYNLKIKKEFFENETIQKIMTNFLKENYQLSKNKYSIDTSYSIVIPHEFDRESKGWDFDINTNSKVFPNKLTVFYRLLIGDNVSNKYSEIETLINQENYSLSIDISISHMPCYDLFSFLNFLNIDVEKAIENNIFLVIEDIIANPYIYNDDFYYFNWIKNQGNKWLDYISSTEWLNDKYVLYLSYIKLFNESVRNKRYPDIGEAYFYLSNPSLIIPIASEK